MARLSSSASAAAPATGGHWREYLIEGWALGSFMIVAALMTVLLESPESVLRAQLPDPGVRRALMGVAMGLTAVLLIRSPWGRQSGAHMNPAVTLGFYVLGKIRGIDALGYMAGQFLGGLLGVASAAAIFGKAFTQAPVHYVITAPGPAGPVAAFLAELTMSFVLFGAVLVCLAHPRGARLTPLVAGVLVALYIAFEAPISGMSINPARSFAAAAPAGAWENLWIYLLAPPLGMLLAARLGRGRWQGHCVKLQHAPDVRCIHCGYCPPAAGAGR